MSIRAPSKRAFEALVRVAGASVAQPSWFATPVDAVEDEGSITVVFHAPESSHGLVRVLAADRSLTVQGRAQAVRLCALPCSIVADGIRTARAGDLLRVVMPKKRPATEAKEPQPGPSP